MKFQYFKVKHHQKKGVFVAVADKDKFTIGWSLCKNKDKYNKETGIHIANIRAHEILAGFPCIGGVPHSMRDTYTHLIDKWKKYYKDRQFVECETILQ